MGHTIRITGETFIHYVDRAVPHLAQAAGYYLFGADAATSVQNLVPDATTDLTVVGAPTYGAGFVEFPGESLSNYFDSGIAMGGDLTMIAVHTKIATSKLLIGSPGANVPSRMYYMGDRFAGSTFGGRGDATASAGVNYHFTAASFHGSVPAQPVKIYGAAGGTVTETIGPNMHPSLTLPSAGPFLIGPSGAYNSNPAGVGYRMAAAMLFDVQLSLAQISDLYSYFRDKLPQRGVTVT